MEEREWGSWGGHQLNHTLVKAESDMRGANVHSEAPVIVCHGVSECNCDEREIKNRKKSECLQGTERENVSENKNSVVCLRKWQTWKKNKTQERLKVLASELSVSITFSSNCSTDCCTRSKKGGLLATRSSVDRDSAGWKVQLMHASGEAKRGWIWLGLVWNIQMMVNGHGKEMVMQKRWLWKERSPTNEQTHKR